MNYDEIISFHGHECPGIAIGYRMAREALKALKGIRSQDEEIVAIVENDACGVDAVQCLTGCTFGKGNLIFRDYGKQVYTFFSRETGRGVRVSFQSQGIPERVREDRDEFTAWLLSVPAEDILLLEDVQIEEPPRAVIRNSVKCSLCGESVMESRVELVDGEPACIPCAGKRDGSRG